MLVVTFSVFILRALSITKKQKKTIENQKVIVERQKLLVDEKNKAIEEKQKDILDSIRYANRIQQSLLPTEKYISKIIEQGKRKLD